MHYQFVIVKKIQGEVSLFKIDTGEKAKKKKENQEALRKFGNPVYTFKKKVI